MTQRTIGFFQILWIFEEAKSHHRDLGTKRTHNKRLIIQNRKGAEPERVTNILNWSPSSQSCHLHISSPTSVTNIDVAERQEL